MSFISSAIILGHFWRCRSKVLASLQRQRFFVFGFAFRETSAAKDLSHAASFSTMGPEAASKDEKGRFEFTVQLLDARRFSP